MLVRWLADSLIFPHWKYSMEFIPTNDCFHHLILLLRLHQDTNLIIEIFKSKGLTVSRSQIKSWRTKTGNKSPGYRPMPRQTLDLFINGLHEYQLVQ